MKAASVRRNQGMAMGKNSLSSRRGLITLKMSIEFAEKKHIRANEKMKRPIHGFSSEQQGSFEGKIILVIFVTLRFLSVLRFLGKIPG